MAEHGERSRLMQQGPKAPGLWRDLAPALVAATVAFALLGVSVPIEDSGLARFYRSFAAVIRAGFSTAAATEETTTFPMWGYGYLLLLTEDVRWLRWIQIALASGGAFALLTELGAGGHLTRREVRLSAWLLVLALPWYAFVLMSYSANVMGTAWLLIALAAWVRHLRSAHGGRSRWLWLAASSVCFGVMLNFRSDYLYAIPVVAGFTLLAQGGSWRPRLAAAGLWTGVVLLFLAPWAWFTATRAGTLLLTSSNSGHVFFVGLGNLPGNRWGITTSDFDPVMYTEIRREFGDERSSMRVDTDAYLSRRFWQMVREHPGEYLKKCAYVTLMIPIEGFYPGVFSPDLRSRVRERFGDGSPGQIVLESPLEVLSMIDRSSLLMVASELQGRLYLWLLIGVVLASRVRRRIMGSPALLLAATLIAYQLAIMVFAFDMRVYLNTQFVPITALGAIWLAGLRWPPWRRAPSSVPA